MTAPFVIFSLPRSRTAWLSAFLSYREWTCHHDLVAKDPDIDLIFRALDQPYAGLVDTGLGYGWQLVKRWYPEARLITIRRPIDEVRRSLVKAGVPGAMGFDFSELDERLDEAEDEGRAQSFQFHELDQPHVIERLWHHALGLPFDIGWWNVWKKLNIQINMPQRLEVLRQNEHRLKALRHVVKEHLYGLDPA